MRRYTFDEDLFTDAAIQNPWPLYQRMRNIGPVVWLPDLGNYALTRHREVQHALRDHRTFISGCGVAADQFGCDFLQGNTVASDGVRHTTLRQAMAQPMLPGELGCIKAQVQAAADDLIDRLVSRGSFDAVQNLACFLPLSVVRDMVGLPEFGQDKMLQWAAAAFDVLGVQNQRGQTALPVIAEMRQFIQRDATRDNLKPDSWTHRIHELVDSGNLSAELAPFAIRDYINPSLDTTISATAEMIFQLANNPDQWELLKQQPELINNAVNEAVRLGTPIRTFSRHTSIDVEISGVTIPKGSRVMMLFASANRDERHFKNPDQFDVTRNVNDHVGFGSGVHMCVGMHLAQLEMESILNAMVSRVGKISVSKPTKKLNNTICAYQTLPCRFQRETRTTAIPTQSSKSNSKDDLLIAYVKARRTVAEGVVCFDLVPEAGKHFPPASAGAHIDVWTPSGLVRQYSLTESLTSNVYKIAVLKTADSRGGSVSLHNDISTGQHLSISAPRNHFPLTHCKGNTLLIAGGIGITPLLAMAWQLHNSGAQFELHVSIRTAARMPFGSDSDSWPFSDRLHIYTDDDASPELAEVNTDKLFSNQPADSQVYVCGPGGFMAKICETAHNAGFDESRIHLEHFAAEIDPDGEPFTLVAQRSAITLQVSTNQTPLQALTDAGIAVETSCQQGVCGSCLTTVLQGIPDHRDMVQTEREKSTNRRIAVCCSRSLSKTLVLDL